ncbi:MAG: type II secretion system protein GspE [Nitrospirae bacterium]|nr:MAG: type II secretion system protein GspE [Nitrospirota bacterium]
MRTLNISSAQYRKYPRGKRLTRKIGQILLGLGYVKEADIEKALELQKSEAGKRRLGEILRDMLLKEEELLQALSLQFNIPIISENEFPQAVPLEKISFAFLKENLILPLSISDKTLNIAVGDPLKNEAIASLRTSFGYDINIFLAKSSAILGHLELLYGSREAVMLRLIEDATEEGTVITTGTTEDVGHLKDLAQEKGVIQLVNVIIENAVKDRASDIHIEPGERNVRVRYRVDGILYDKEQMPVAMQAAVSSRIKLLSQMNIAERRLPQDGRIKSHFGGKDIDIRVSTIPTIYGESIVMRLLDRETSFITLTEIGFDDMLIERYEGIIHKPYGMILITGPTGSGKTTTLYASLDRINSSEKKIITIEEPVEYLMPGINQIQVRPKIGLTFASGLRHIVRQDPDIIMVGEIRDLETGGIAIHAALTGHLIFSTLHTNDAPGAIARLMDMGVENYLVSSTLIGVMAQRLVRRVCPECKEKHAATAEVRAELSEDINIIWKGKGCGNCLGTGYRGRIAIFELLVVDDEIRDLVMRRATVREIKDKAISLGMRTLRQDGIEKIKKGITTVDEVLRVTQLEL